MEFLPLISVPLSAENQEGFLAPNDICMRSKPFRGCNTEGREEISLTHICTCTHQIPLDSASEMLPSDAASDGCREILNASAG